MTLEIRTAVAICLFSMLCGCAENEPIDPFVNNQQEKCSTLELSDGDFVDRDTLAQDEREFLSDYERDYRERAYAALALVSELSDPSITVHRIDGAGGRGDPRVLSSDKSGINDDNNIYRHDDKHFYGYRILGRHSVESAVTLSHVKDVLGSPCNYGRTGAMCFDPGMGVSLEEDGRTIDLVICLECNWADFYENEELRDRVAISVVGNSRLGKIHRELFP